MSLPAYWSAMIASNTKVATTVIQLLMPFSSTWLCEACFSALLEIKNKARNQLIAEQIKGKLYPLPNHALTSLSSNYNCSHLVSAAAMMCMNLLSLSFNKVILQYLCQSFLLLPCMRNCITCVLTTHNFGRESFGYVGLQSGSLNKKDWKPLN